MKNWIRTCILILLLAAGIGAVPAMAKTSIALNKSQITMYKGQSQTLQAAT